MNKLFGFDKKLLKENGIIIGTDEAGRGPGAGDVVAATVYFPEIDKSLTKALEKLNDSKKITEKVREELFEVILQTSVYDIVFGSVEEIERTNILKTSLNCMKKACSNVIEKIGQKDVLVLVDGNRIIPQFEYPQRTIVKGDGKSASIAAASVLAKVTRDRYMLELDRMFPEYLWAKNKGYLTEEHLEAVDKYGLTKYHRKKFFDKHFAKQLSLF
ncbi:MAG: ribonuclease HII [Candidatus Gastranaerophilales bacterium]|nr:ribonuclease HII [Candidatus Gastranaerophilales bacterium]